MSARVTKQEPIDWRENSGEKLVSSGRANSEHKVRLKMVPNFISLVLQNEEKNI
jgi:hypothetical protein